MAKVDALIFNVLFDLAKGDREQSRAKNTTFAAKYELP